MAKYRTTQMGYWNDPYIEELSKDGKLLYLYLITSPYTNNVGLLEITSRRISNETNIDINDVRKLLEEMERDGKVIIDGNKIWLVNFIKHQTSTSPKLLKGLRDEALRISSIKIIGVLIKKYPILNISQQEIPYQYPIDTVSIPSEEREREEEVELEREKEVELEREGEGEGESKGEGGEEKLRPLSPGGDLAPPKDLELLTESKILQSPKDPCPHKVIVDLYHEILPELPHVRVWGDENRGNLRVRWREDKARQNIDWWRGFFLYVKKSRFLTGQISGRDGEPFFANLGWLVRPKNFAKVLNANYNPEALDVFQRAAMHGYDGTKAISPGDNKDYIDIDVESRETEVHADG
ncbi:MAG: hypothetical protein RR382_05350 [Tannerellaceae bacterium]